MNKFYFCYLLGVYNASFFYSLHLCSSKNFGSVHSYRSHGFYLNFRSSRVKIIPCVTGYQGSTKKDNLKQSYWS